MQACDNKYLSEPLGNSFSAIAHAPIDRVPAFANARLANLASASRERRFAKRKTPLVGRVSNAEEKKKGNGSKAKGRSNHFVYPFDGTRSVSLSVYLLSPRLYPSFLDPVVVVVVVVPASLSHALA